MIDRRQALAHAIAIAESAGRLLQDAFDKSRTTSLTVRTKSSARDFVTEVDAAAQKHIIERIRKLYPEHRFFAEEEGADQLGDTKSPYRWVIDPLDGTTNFIHRKLSFGTMIALMEGNDIILGVMYLPLKNDLFHGSRGGGAFWNGRPVILRQTKSMDDAILCTNISSRARACGGALHVPILQCASVHNYGCAAEEMGEVLRGGNDGVFYEGPGLWDIAPGCLMIEEAGGKARWEFIDPRNPRKGINCAAGTTEVFGAVEKAIFKN